MLGYYPGPPPGAAGGVDFYHPQHHYNRLAGMPVVHQQQSAYLYNNNNSYSGNGYTSLSSHPGYGSRQQHAYGESPPMRHAAGMPPANNYNHNPGAGLNVSYPQPDQSGLDMHNSRYNRQTTGYHGGQNGHTIQPKRKCTKWNSSAKWNIEQCRKWYQVMCKKGFKCLLSTREQRNRAEKQRRDKLNSFINELSTLVPMIAQASAASRRIDKTSILRLTVTFLRVHTILIPGTERMQLVLPAILENLDLARFMLTELEGVMLIVNAAGKIIFVSDTVEQVLGHTPHDLMGLPLFNITCLEDHDELRRNLKPDEDEATATQSVANTSECASDDSSDSSTSSSHRTTSSPAAAPPALPSSSSAAASASTPASTSATAATTTSQRQRRSFYLRLSKRPACRTEQPQYELVHVVGHLRVPQRKPASTNASRRGAAEQPYSNNEVLLVAMVRPHKEKRLAELSLLEACRDEYITRHHVDGRIIFTDHRISVVAGYLAEEVTGKHGFNYMHKDDVRWTMIALRQMYCKGESYGQSCYRLQTKTGQFIYMRTHGYLELADDNETIQSFVCINSLVSEEEGEELNKRMKRTFSPLITEDYEQVEPGIAAIAPRPIQQEPVDSGDSSGEVEDPNELQFAIRQLISKIPTALHKPPSPGACPDNQYLKLTIMSKRLPPASLQSSSIGFTPPIVRTQDETHQVQVARVQQPPARPSVLRMTSSRSRESSSSNDTCASVGKRLRTEDGAVLVRETVNHTASRASVLMSSRLGTKRLSDGGTQPPEPQTPVSPTYPIPAQSMDFSDPFTDPLSPMACPIGDTETHIDIGSHLSHLINEPSEDHIMQTNELLEEWRGNLEMSQAKIQYSVQEQRQQISEIEEGLQSIPAEDINRHGYSSLTSSLAMCKATHDQHEQILRTLQLDTQSIHHHVLHHPHGHENNNMSYLEKDKYL